MKNTTFVSSIGLLLISASLTAACASPPPPAEVTLVPLAETSSPVAEAGQGLQMPTPLPRTRDGAILVSGHVMPANSVDVYPPLAQLVSEVMVREGDVVEAGDPLLSFDAGSLELDVKEAEAGLREERANYEFLLSSATPEQINAASAQVERARAQLRQAELGVTAEDVAAAEARLANARAELALLQKGPTENDIAVKQAGLDDAKARLQSVRDTRSAEKNVARAALEHAANDLREAQAVYETIYWRNQNGDPSDEEIRNEQLAELAMRNAELDVKVAQLHYDEAQKLEVEAIKAAESEVVRTQALLDMLFQPADPNAIQAAQKAIEEAKIRLDQLKGERYTSDVEEARANLAYNEALLSQLSSDPNASSLARAEARIYRAETALERAKYDLKRAVLLAPIGGQVTRVKIFPNTYSKTEDVAITITDFSSWVIQIDEVNELDIVGIRVGDAATISFLALPGFELNGTVTEIEQIGQRPERQLGARYQVIITPDTWDERLRWNMTSTVAILPQSQ